MKKSEICDLAEKYGTPFYLMEKKKLKSQYDKLKRAFPENTKIAYATKANYSETVINTFKNIGTHFDVFSSGELDHLADCGCDPRKFIYTSVSETKDEFEYALRKGVRTFVLGSMNGIKRFTEAAEENGVENSEIMLRTQPLESVSAAVSTSGKQSKFGLVFGGEGDSVSNGVRKIRAGNFELSGFHCHLGSQMADPESYVSAIRKMLSYASENLPNINILDIGGGYPAPYNEEVPEIDEFGEKISKELSRWREKLGNIKLLVEPGRFLTSTAGTLVSSIVNVKRMYGRKVLVLDVSEDMVKVERHGETTKPKIITESDKQVETSIAGNLCHSMDWISEESKMLPDAELGEIVTFENLGAYQINHNIPYNLRNMPKILTVSVGKIVEDRHPFTIICEES